MSDGDPALDAEATRRLIADRVRVLLTEAEMSQPELAQRLGVSVQTVWRSQRGQRDWTAPEIAKMAVVFDVPAGFFFGEDIEAEWRQRMRAARDRAQRFGLQLR